MTGILAQFAPEYAIAELPKTKEGKTGRKTGIDEFELFRKNKQTLGLSKDTWIHGEANNYLSAHFLACGTYSEFHTVKEMDASTYPIWKVDHLMV